jgi:hypothetical protein
MTVRGATMPVTRVLLFQNGLGYFERRGATGDTVDLVTRREHLDDVLKSLAVVDRAGGRVASVRVLASAARAETVTLRLGLTGSATHDLSVSYMSEVSGWRPSYRVVLGPEGHARLQGFAVVDNHTGEAWRGVHLGLSTATPLSFRYALQTERNAQRPELTSDGRLVRRPAESAQGSARRDLLLQNIAPVVEGNDPGLQNDVQAAYAATNVALPRPNSRAGHMVPDNPSRPTENPAASPNAQPLSPEDFAASLGSEDPSAGFTLESPGAMDLDTGESAMVPFVDQTIDGAGVYLFRPATAGGASATHPYRAVLLRNPLEAPLLGGPVAVYDASGVGGDGVTAVIPARAHAFVAYAMSPDIAVSRNNESAEDEVRVTQAAAGMVTVELQSVARTRFTLDASRPLDARVFLHVPSRPGFEPRSLPAGAVETPTGSFVPVAAGQAHHALAFDLLRRDTRQVHLETDPSHTYVPAFLEFLARSPGAGDTVPRLRQIYTRTTELRDLRASLEQDLGVQQRALAERREALAALRDVPANGALRQRIGRGVAEGVAQVDALTRRMVTANAEALSLREEWYVQLRALVVPAPTR